MEADPVFSAADAAVSGSGSDFGMNQNPRTSLSADFCISVAKNVNMQGKYSKEERQRIRK